VEAAVLDEQKLMEVRKGMRMNRDLSISILAVLVAGVPLLVSIATLRVFQ
jgi:hypothetical protein